ncbi:MAG: glutamate-1-semialdehyde 2,1-aminomutase [Methanomassiliicoccus sp.]|nr:glutamate-1-semialdehyde 2,1-aminomutase [Methanomassiliicoccus sp.]
MTGRSECLYHRAQRVMPGGVSSPVRAYQPYPRYIAEAQGDRIIDVDGNEYIDYCMAFGPLILGHAHPSVVSALQAQAGKGTLYGAPIEAEAQFAEDISREYRSMEMLRFVSTGTEATMHALRLARGHTGRKKVLKFEGCFHGAHDAVLVKAGSGATTHGAPNSLGVLEEVASNTLLATFNDLGTVEQALRANRGEVAAVIVEPVMGNVGPVLPSEGFIQGLRELTTAHDTLLIFDEVITGFRLSMGGAQRRYGITPDITTLGKIAGGGMPIGVFGASEEIMSKISPLGKVYQAGTFSGNPMSLAAGMATVKELRAQGHEGLDRKGDLMRRGLEEALGDMKVPHQVVGIGSMFQLFLSSAPVRNYREALSSDSAMFDRLFRRLLEEGIYLAPSQFETNFLSTAHTDEDIKRTVDSFATSLSEVSA